VRCHKKPQYCLICFLEVELLRKRLVRICSLCELLNFSEVFTICLTCSGTMYRRWSPFLFCIVYRPSSILSIVLSGILYYTAVYVYLLRICTVSSKSFLNTLAFSFLLKQEGVIMIVSTGEQSGSKNTNLPGIF
jgi:hypothetical protein